MVMEPNLFIYSKHTFRKPNIFLALLWTPCITVVKDKSLSTGKLHSNWGDML